ncbi:hypothetical protein V5799_012560 [Amblyomma americanum]|uniref:Uncharacterized protein n=1 Tax=Amblyomma americanum TaxID=6943 RepID=A0AAQ4EDP1_AMBAM
MDQADKEEAGDGAAVLPAQDAIRPLPPAEEEAQSAPTKEGKTTSSNDYPEKNDEKMTNTSDTATVTQQGTKDVMSSVGATAAKRHHDESGNEIHDTRKEVGGEPPLKTTPTRRSALKPAPKIPPEPRPERKTSALPPT